MISKILPLFLAGAIALASGIAIAQQAPDAAKTPATPGPTADSSSNSDAAEAAAAAAAIAKANAAAAAANAPAKITDEATIAKLARKAGWRTETKNGAMVYCKDSVDVGTRFTSKKCATPTQLAAVLEQQQFERDRLKQRACGNCGGGK